MSWNKLTFAVALLIFAGCTSDNPSYVGHHDLAATHDLASVASGPGVGDLASPVAQDFSALEDMHSHQDMHHHRDMSLPVPDLASGSAPVCMSTCGACPIGACCGNGCCGTGEWCDNGTCRCGNEAACTNGQTCGGAPIGDPLGCGQLCCGGLGSVCPL